RSLRRQCPTSSLFPYTTRCRSVLALIRAGVADADARRDAHRASHDRHGRGELDTVALFIGQEVRDRIAAGAFGSIERILEIAARSQEHTSELQSREKLVCRLLI